MWGCQRFLRALAFWLLKVDVLALFCFSRRGAYKSAPTQDAVYMSANRSVLDQRTLERRRRNQPHQLIAARKLFDQGASSNGRLRAPFCCVLRGCAQNLMRHRKKGLRTGLGPYMSGFLLGWIGLKYSANLIGEFENASGFWAAGIFSLRLGCPFFFVFFPLIYFFDIFINAKNLRLSIPR